jgi:hypothetical protein
LRPDYLNDLVRDEINRYIDEEKWTSRGAEIESIKKRIYAAGATFRQ